MDPGRPTRGGGPGPSLSSSGVFYHAGVQPSLSGAAASSLLTDANSPGAPHLQRSASVNNDSASRMIPTSPLSFSSNNEYTQKRGGAGASSATSEVTEQDTRLAKRPRSDNRQEEIMQQQLMQLMNPNCHQTPQMQSMIHQRRIAQQQYSMMRAQMMQQHQQQQVRSQMERHYAHPEAAGVVPVKGGVCARMLMKYFFHQRHGRTENTIAYWRKFVGQYFAPHAKKKWCLSKYENVGNHAFGAFPHTSVAAWQCDICGSKSGKGFEAASEVLPRLFQFKYDCGVPPQKNDGGVIDEILFLDMPHESRLPNGVMVLEYARAVQKCTYEQGHVIREGQLRIIFTPGLKICSWEFCVRSHEEFLSRRLVAPQVSQLLQVAQKYQTVITDGGPAGVSPQDLQTMCNMFVTAGNQIVKNLELQSLNDLGFAKRYVRCLQEAELVTSMKDLMDFEQEHKLGPIASMNSYAREYASKLQNRRTMEEQPTVNNLHTEESMLNKIMVGHTGMNSIHSGMRVLNNPAQGAAAWSNYHNMQKNSMNPNHNPFQPPLTQSGSIQFNRSSSVPTNSSVYESPCINQQQLQSNGSMSQHVNAQPSLANKQHLESTNAIDQILQEVLSNSEGASQSLTMPNMNSRMTTGDAVGVASSIGAMVGRMNASSAHSAPGRTNIMTNNIMSRTNSQKSISNSTTVDGISLDPKPDLPQISHTPEVEDDFTLAESGLLDADFADFDFDFK